MVRHTKLLGPKCARDFLAEAEQPRRGEGGRCSGFPLASLFWTSQIGRWRVGGARRAIALCDVVDTARTLGSRRAQKYARPQRNDVRAPIYEGDCFVPWRAVEWAPAVRGELPVGVDERGRE